MVVLHDPDEHRRQRAEGVRQRDALGHGGHRHKDRHWCADGGTNDEADDDPLILDNALVKQGADNSEEHTGFSQEHTASGRGW